MRKLDLSIATVHAENAIDDCIGAARLVEEGLSSNVCRCSPRNLGEVSLSPEIGERALELVKKYAKSDGTGELDALIAATAMGEGKMLAAKNAKHFRNIEGLNLEIAKYPAE